ncbi:Septin-9 SL3-3 integration site 1 protein [Triplophysa tibetana]|uniref:Septin-9 SL3-3 integration site 1 protein n=1 Tax=Triplophysa tibetana TaxID=1572043 RepID=A0A5A9N996_9TELE|nr:Septin-9 SL3-3 integration site 1 protein [Triplophysa tibetana]
MSGISVNDHLEGILSDFEALKRSFDIDDDIPTFSPTSSVTSPMSPSSILNKTNDVRNPGNQVSPPYRSRISINCSPAQSPVMRSRMVPSLSFNRGTMGKPAINANSGINRAVSFQNKFNPNGFNSSSGPGSDNDSLHSSSSSLEYQASSKLGSYTSPPQSPVGVGEYKVPRLGSPALKKYSSHGNMFHSELEGPLFIPTDPMGISHGSMPSLDLQMEEMAGMRRVTSPGSRFTNVSSQWNTNPHNIQNSTPFSRDSSLNQQSSKSKEPVRLHKFPLDLDNLVFKSQTESPAAPKPPPRFHMVSNSPTVSASSSASISSMDSTDLSMTHNNNIIDKKEAITPHGAIPVPNIIESPLLLSPAQTPQFNMVSKPQVVQVAPVSPPAASGQMETKHDMDQYDVHANETVGSILQRIASFSRVEPPVAEARPLVPLSNGVKKDSPVIRHLEPKRSQDTAQDLDLEPSVQMEEEKEVIEEKEVEERRVEMEHSPPCIGESDTQGIIKGRDLFGYVGIEAVLDQMRRKTMKAAFEFNIMVVGQSGLGKSTLVNTLFKSKVSRKSCTPNHEEKISKTVHLQSVSHIIEEKGVKMKLTVIDTPGFGDQINNENCWEPIVKYVNEQYEKYLKEELNVNRKRIIPDSRVHCCVYFLPATGHWLRPIDVEFMRRLGKIVSIVPVIAKADTLTLEERLEFKQRIRQDLQANGIRVYPQREYDEDAEDRILNDKIRENIPFAVVGTDKEHQVNGNKVLGRKTKWGIIEVENVAHCEFAHLRDLLIRSHLQDLKDVTHNIHYESYRVQRLNESNANGLALSPLTFENGTLEKSDAESHL